MHIMKSKKLLCNSPGSCFLGQTKLIPLKTWCLAPLKLKKENMIDNNKTDF